MGLELGSYKLRFGHSYFTLKLPLFVRCTAAWERLWGFAPAPPIPAFNSIEHPV